LLGKLASVLEVARVLVSEIRIRVERIAVHGQSAHRETVPIDYFAEASQRRGIGEELLRVAVRFGEIPAHWHFDRPEAGRDDGLKSLLKRPMGEGGGYNAKVHGF
jgi:hypothetical protein